MPIKQYDPSNGPLPSFLRDLPHHRSPLIVKILDALFHWLLRFWKWIWSTIIVGVVSLTLLLNFAKYGDAHLDHPQRWAIWLFLHSHVTITIVILAILLILLSLGVIAHFTPTAHPQSNNFSPFTYVRDLDRVSFRMGDHAAATFPYIRAPVERIYQQAAATLRTSATDTQHPKQGILVTGAANAGKTRLAFEALLAALPGWDALIWNVGDREDRIPTASQLAGRNVAVFLDDIQNYAAGGAISGDSDGRSAQTSVAGPAATLRALHQRICQDAAHVVFVATCRREDRKAAEGSLGWLFEKLDEVAIPTFNRDEDSPEARTIIAEFREHGAIRDEWNGTLGSLVLGLGRKRQQYLNLVNQHNPDNPAVSVLRAMKLLTLGGIPELTGKRIRAVCDEILHEPSLAALGKVWDDALAELKRLEFVTITPTNDGDETLRILKDDYFEQVVDDYPADYQREAHRTQLQVVLASLDDAEGLFYLGNGFYVDGQFTSAIRAYEQVIHLNPTYITYNNLGTVLGTLERYDEAIAAFEAAIRLNPTYAGAYYNLGTALGTLERYDEAIAAFEAAIRLNPTYANAYYNLGMALGTLERYDEAIAAFEAAIRLNPTDATAYNNMGAALGTLQRYDAALQAYEQAIRLNPADATAYNNLGSTLDTLERYDEAIAAFQKAISLNPEFAAAYSGLGFSLGKQKHYAMAFNAFEKSIELNPTDAVAWRNKSVMLTFLGRYNEALNAFDQSLAHDPHDAMTWRLKADLLKMLSRYDEALAACEKSLDLKPQDVRFWQLKAAILDELGREDEAHAAEEHAKQLEEQA